MGQVFDGDEERVKALQQWFGYNLVSDNRQHKLALLIGPPRSGKGTTMAVMSELLGKHNVASSSLASLGGRFGREPLVGKLAALIDEGHLGKFSDTSLVLERLKAISGGSEQAVDRKGLAALPSVALKVRFTIAVNELPRLRVYSGLPLVGSDLLVESGRASATAHTLGCVMGMDALDLVFRLEKRLGINISRAEGIAVLFATAGDIHNYLVAKLRGEY